VADVTPSADGSGAARRRLSPRLRLALAALAWLVATALVLGALRAVGGPAALAAVRRAHPAWLLAAVLCHGSILPLWAWQTVVLLPRPAGAPAPVGFGRVFEVQALSATAANTVPAFLGQATGVALLAERAGVGSAAALSVFAQHNLVEGLAKLAMVGVAAQVVPLPPRMRGAVAALTVGTRCCVVARRRGCGPRPAARARPARRVVRGARGAPPALRWGGRAGRRRSRRCAIPPAGGGLASGC
jgi:hypothetical protein